VLCPGFVKTRINENTRNRPEDVAPSPFEADSPRSVELRKALAEMTLTGLEPARVADLVHDAVLSRQFYIHTDPAAMPFIRARHEAIEASTDPPPGELD
jgi:hypothetical protein